MEQNEKKVIKTVKVKKVVAKPVPEQTSIFDDSEGTRVESHTEKKVTVKDEQRAHSKKPTKAVYQQWWFWLALAAIVLAMVALLTYGGNGTSPDASSNSAVVTQSAEGADESEGSLSVDENLLTVEVTMPASFFDGETPEEIQADAKEAGFLSCTVNSDGSVTYKMTKGKRVEILREYKKTIDSIIQEYVSGGENAPQSFKNITYNDKVTQFDVRVDRATYENSWFDSMYALGLYIAGGYYQILDGVPNDQVDVKVNFIDDATGEFIESGSYQDMIANGE